MIGPNKEDTEKLHAEVNQIANQRVVLTTFAIAVFGATIGLLIPRSGTFSHSSENSVGIFSYMASALLTLVLFALFLLIHFLTRMMRIITTYLDVSGASNWERDWVTYRSRFRPLGYMKSISVIFLLLGVMSSGFPILLWTAYPLKLEPHAGIIICVLIGTLYILFILGMGMIGWFTDEDDIRRRWKELKQIEELKKNVGNP